MPQGLEEVLIIIIIIIIIISLFILFNFFRLILHNVTLL